MTYSRGITRQKVNLLILYLIKNIKKSETLSQIKLNMPREITLLRNLNHVRTTQMKKESLLKRSLLWTRQTNSSPMIKKYGSEITDPTEIVENFNHFFVNIGSSLANDLPQASHNFQTFLRGPQKIGILHSTRLVHQRFYP